MAYCPPPVVEQCDGVSDGVKGFRDRVDKHDEELVGDKVRKRGRVELK
jgi:hypothetical protein